MDKPASRTAKHAVLVALAYKSKNQTWLAHKMRISESTLSKVLAGRQAPSPEFVERLLEHTGVDLNHFPRTKAGKLRPRDDEPELQEAVS